MLHTHYLSDEDLRDLVRHPDENVRARMAQKLGHNVRRRILSEQDSRVVQHIFDLVLRDAAEMVRRALAITLRNSPNLPRDTARRLARDVDSIAVPVLRESPVLTDEDLIGILQSRAAAKARAVAGRPVVSGSVVEAIIRVGDSEAVATAAANDGAEFNDQLCQMVMEEFGNDDLINQSFIDRRDLPPLMVEKLIAEVSAEVAVNLVRRHALSPQKAVELAVKSQERALVDLVDQGRKAKEKKALVEQIYKAGRLTPSLMLRASCSGDIEFLEEAFVCLTDMNVGKVRIMIHDSGAFGMATLCKAAGLSSEDCKILGAAVKIRKDLHKSGREVVPQQFRRLMVERVLTLPLKLSSEDIDYLMEILNEKPEQASRSAQRQA